MPRQETRGRTQRAAVAPAPLPSVRSEVATPISTSSRNRGNAAFDLANLLNAGADLNASQDPSRIAKAEADVQRGTVDEDGGYVYRKAVTKLRARARWIEDENAVEESLNDLDLNNISEAELDTHLNEQFKTLYDGVDDPDIVGQVAPKMEAYRASVKQRVLELQDTAEKEQNGADLMHIAETNYEKDVANDRPFDYLGFHQDVRDVVRIGADQNETYFTVLADMAIRNGDPDLLRNLPDSWADGQKTFKHIPSFNEKMRAAENRAIAAKASMAKAEAEAQDAENDALFNETSLEAMRLAIGGDQAAAQQMIYGLGRVTGMDAKDILNMHKGMSALATVGDKLPQDPIALAGLTVSAYDGSATTSDLAEAFAMGVFGYDDGGLSNFRQLLSVVSTRAKSDPEVNRQFTFNVSLLKSRYNPQKDPLGKINEQVNQLRDTALKMYQRMTYTDGMDPDEAFSKTIAIMDERQQRLPSAAISMGQGMNAGEAIGHLLAGDISPTQARTNGLSIDVLDQALQQQAITGAEYDELLSILAGE